MTSPTSSARTRTAWEFWGGQYSYTTAAGLFMSAIGFMLTYLANRVSNALTGYGLW